MTRQTTWVATALRPAIGVAALVALTAGSAFAGHYKVAPVKGGGSITGRVFFAGDYPESDPLKVTQDQKTCGATQPAQEFIVSPKTKGLKNVVVYLASIAAGKPFSKGTPTLAQNHCRYEPHVQVVRANRKLHLVNRDDLMHNVHAYFDPEGKRSTMFNIGQSAGAKAKKKMRKAGIVHVVCDVHSWMSAWVVVRDNPYYSVTDADGHFEITDIPPGEYELIIWHEGLGEATRKVVVHSGEATDVPFPLGKADDED